MGVVGAGDGARGLVEHDGHVFGGLDLFAVEDDLILPGKDADAQLGDLTIDVNESLFDEEFGAAAGSMATAGQVFLESFTGHGDGGAQAPSFSARAR